MEPKLVQYLHRKGMQLGLPTGGTFELTPRCNFNCKMCYVHLTQEEQVKRGRELTTEEWLRIGKEARDAGTVFLLLTGGEPTLRPDFPELMHKFKEMGLLVTVNSNGVLLEGKLLELIKNDPPTRINISLYGTSDETYEQLCGVPAYDRVIRNIEALRASGVEVKVNMSVTPTNRRELKNVLETAERLNIRTQAATYMFPPIRLHPELCGQSFRMDAEEAGRLQAQYEFTRFTKAQFLKRVQALCNKVSPDADSEEDCGELVGDTIHCRAGKSSFWIDWDGKMLPCGQMAEPAVNVLETGFAEAWRQTRVNAAAIRLPPECNSCDVKNICQACAAMCYCETGRFNGRPDYVCRMKRSYIDAMMQYWKTEYGEER
ncbi:MAG: radical SAM protein [Oscillospiraceae bacterium]|nr:radical SAM protein [Oscillospiraceae bacterium]